MSHGGKFAFLVLSVVVLAGCGEGAARGVLPQKEAAKELRVAIDSSAEGSESSGEAAATQTRTGWATIKGRFIVEGTPAALPNLRIGKDQAVCAPGGRAVKDDSIAITDGALANLAIYAQGLGASGDNVHESAATPASDTVLFDQKACVFLTHVCAMQIGQKLKIKNSDSVGHNTDIKAKRSASFNETVPPNLEAFYTPTNAEKSPVPVSCAVHPWMKAYLFPHENGYVSVTSQDGTFELKNLPAGIDLKIQVWHEKLKKFENVEVNGTKLTWKRGAVKLDSPLEPDEVRELEIKIPASLFGG